MKVIKNILIPVDFTEQSDHAYSLALKMAQKLDAQITAMSVVPGPRDLATSKISKDDPDTAEWYKKLSQTAKRLESWAQDKSLITDRYTTIGAIDESIIQYAESNDIDLIVMGTKGEQTNTTWSKGSHAMYISNHSTIPLLSIKKKIDDVNMAEVLFVSDFLENKVEELTILKAVQSAFGAQLNLLKIQTPSNTRSELQVNEDILRFAETNGLDNYSINIHQGKSVEEGIKDYSEQCQIDIIALGTHQGKGFSKLFKHSISDELVNHLDHPLLTFPI